MALVEAGGAGVEEEAIDGIGSADDCALPRPTMTEPITAKLKAVPFIVAVFRLTAPARQVKRESTECVAVGIAALVLGAKSRRSSKVKPKPGSDRRWSEMKERRQCDARERRDEKRREEKDSNL